MLSDEAVQAYKQLIRHTTGQILDDIEARNTAQLMLKVSQRAKEVRHQKALLMKNGGNFSEEKR